LNYTIKVDEITVQNNMMTISVSGEIDTVLELSKPKITLYFENGLENRRIPMVIKTVYRRNGKCQFIGKYKYNLNMLYWTSRGEKVTSKMYFNFMYGDLLEERVPFEIDLETLETDDYCYNFEFKEDHFEFSPNPENIRKIRGRGKFKKPIKFLYKFFSFLIAIVLLPWFLVEALLALMKIVPFAKGVKNPNPINRIIGQLNRRVKAFSNVKISIVNMKRALIIFSYNFFKKVLKIKENRITLISERGNEISGNFEFVYDKIKDDKSLDIRLLLNTKSVKKMNLFEIIAFAKVCSSSKVIILDEFTARIHYIDLKPETTLIQLWHACGAFKTFGFTRLGKEKGSPQVTRMHRSYDYVTVSTKNVKRCHSEGFGISDEKVVPTGIPRTDVFFDEEYKKNVRDSFYEKYPNFKDKKILMFAPTFRGAVKETAYYPVSKMDLQYIYESLEGEYAIIVKHHPFVKQVQPIPEMYQDYIIDLSKGEDINDLLFVTDLIITDYSSLVFEASLLDIPMLFYAYDLESYIANRDFYFDFVSFVPGKIVYTQEEIVEAMKNKDFEQEKVFDFSRKFFDEFDGKSTDRVASLIYDSLKK